MDPRASRPRFVGYGIAEDERGLLDWAWATERLATARNYWVSTTRPDGRPHAMPVWAVWLDGAVMFSSGERSAKARNLAAKPAAVVHLESGDEAVILEGDVETLEDDKTRRRFVEAYEPKYGIELNADQLARVYALRPRLAYAWRERDYPKSATRFDFPGG